MADDVDWSQFKPSAAQGQDQVDWSQFKPAATPAPAAPQGALENFGQGLEYAGGAAVTGINRGLGALGDVEVGLNSLADKYLPENTFGRPASEVAKGPRPHIFPTSQDYQRATDYLGLTGHEWQKPLSETQNAVGEGISGATSALPTALLGGEGAFVPAMAQGASGGLAAEGARQIAPNSPLTAAAAGVLGGGGAQIMQHILQGDPVQNVSKLLGGASTLQEAGEHLQASARAWRNDVMPVEVSKAWAPVDAAIPPNTPTPLTNFGQTLDDITKSGGSLTALTDQLTPALASKLQSAYKARMTPQGPPGMQGPVQPPTWEEAAVLRSTVGNAMTTPSVVESIGQKNLNKIYGALSDDQRSAAASISPETADAVDQANAQTKQLYDHANGPISKIISDPNAPVDPKIRPEQAAQRLLNTGKLGATDLETLQSLQGTMPAAIGQLASAKLQMDPQGWAKLAPEAKKALVPNEILQAALEKALPTRPANLKAAAYGGITGAALGPEVGIALAHALGSSLDPVTAGAFGGLTAGGIGVAGALGQSVLNNPAMLAGPVRGAIASGESNALLPKEGPASPLLGR